MNRYRVTIDVMSDSEVTAASSAAKMLITHPSFASVLPLPTPEYEFSERGTLVLKQRAAATTERKEVKPDE